MTQNQLRYAEYLETKRHNIAGETETHRNNVALLTETNRHNVSTESETNRHNVATERLQGEANAINQAHYERVDAATREHYERQDAISASNLELQRAIAAETARHNAAQETINAQIARETARHNVATERYQFVSQAETSRHNVETESIQSINANAAAQNAQTNFLALGNQDAERIANIQYKQEQIQDLESQQAARKVNTILNAVDTASESVRDVSAAAKNAVEAAGSGINLFTDIFNLTRKLPVSVLFN